MAKTFIFFQKLDVLTIYCTQKHCVFWPVSFSFFFFLKKLDVFRFFSVFPSFFLSNRDVWEWTRRITVYSNYFPQIFHYFLLFLSVKLRCFRVNCMLEHRVFWPFFLYFSFAYSPPPKAGCLAVRCRQDCTLCTLILTPQTHT